MRACANLNELLVLANMESCNAVLIGKKIDWKERMVVLRKLTRTLLFSLENLNTEGMKKLKVLDNEK